MRLLSSAGRHLSVAIIASVLPTRNDAAECHVSVTGGTWHPAAAFEAINAGIPTINVPNKIDGYNRTVKLRGFCHNVLFAASGFDCSRDSDDGLLIPVKGSAPGLSVNFAGARCELSAMSLSKKMDGGAEIQFRFEMCSDGASTTVVALPLKKSSTQTPDMLPWLKKVCAGKFGTTTTQAASDVSMASSKVLKTQKVGDGYCKASVLSNESKPDTENECQIACGGSMATGTEVKADDEACTGYAFKQSAESGEKCVLFKGKVVKIDKDTDAWMCFNMTMETAVVATTTGTPPPMEQGILNDRMQLKVSEAMGGPPPSMSTAQLRQFSPPKDAPGCFSPMNWFTLEDDDGVPGSYPIAESVYDELMEMLPPPLNITDSVDSEVVLDRLLVISDCSEREDAPTAARLTGDWGRACKTKDTVETAPVSCDMQEILNSIVTGIVTPVVTWFAVKMAYDRVLKPKYKAADDLIDPCSITIVGVLSLVAFIVALLVALILTQIINLILRLTGCAEKGLVLSIIMFAAFIATAVAIMVAVAYLKQSHPKNQENKKKKDKTYLVMEVEEGAGGQTWATPVYLETNPMHSQAGSESSMAIQSHNSRIMLSGN